MKIVNIIGGLGNQMFQYAFALSLKYHFPNEEVLIDISHYNYLLFKKIGVVNLHNGFEMYNVFPHANLRIATWKQIMKVSWYVPNYLLSRCVRKIMPQRRTECLPPRKMSHVYDSKIYAISGDCYYEGYWESIKYYLPLRNVIIDTFRHPEPNDVNRHYISEISTSNSVGIHVRRGDYLLHPAFKGICDIEYYKEAIKEIRKIKKNYVFYFFSNDLKWCEEYLKPLVEPDKVVLVHENTGKMSCWDMFLMTYCKDLIIANSTFSWWGAFLNERKGRVIAPSKWTNRDVKYDMWDSTWIRL